jgi:hypothetical protein
MQIKPTVRDRFAGCRNVVSPFIVESRLVPDVGWNMYSLVNDAVTSCWISWSEIPWTGT